VEIDLLRPLLAYDFGSWSRADIDGCLDGDRWRDDEAHWLTRGRPSVVYVDGFGPQQR
jgi:hypothetical protein